MQPNDLFPKHHPNCACGDGVSECALEWGQEHQDDDCCPDCGGELSPIAMVGEPAPDFTAEAYDPKAKDFKTISLSDLKGKWVVLFFYPADFTFVCPTEITGFAKHLDDFTKEDAVVLGCSTDGKHVHQAWAKTKDIASLNYPLLADRTQEIARAYGVLIEDSGEALRGTFIIDPEGKLRFMVVHDLNVGRSVAETLRVLQALKTGGLCPVEWKHGEGTLHPVG